MIAIIVKEKKYLVFLNPKLKKNDQYCYCEHVLVQCWFCYAITKTVDILYAIYQGFSKTQLLVFM